MVVRHTCNSIYSRAIYIFYLWILIYNIAIFFKTLTELEYSTATAKEMYKKVYGEIPSYTDIVADGTVPESFEKDGLMPK